MKSIRSIAIGAILMLASGAASAISVDLYYVPTFVNGSALQSALGLTPDFSVITGTADHGAVVGAGAISGFTEYDVNSFTLNFGTPTSNVASNTSFFPAVVGIGGAGVLPYLASFATTFTLAGQDYDLYFDPSFLGARSFTMYTAGTLDSTFLQAGGVAAIPVPAALPLLVGGVGRLGLVARRRKA